MNKKITHIINIDFGKNDVPYQYLFFQRDLNFTLKIFKDFFNIDLKNNKNFLIHEHESLEEATDYYRTVKFSKDETPVKIDLEEFLEHDDVLVMADDIVTINIITFLIQKLKKLEAKEEHNYSIEILWDENLLLNYIVKYNNKILSQFDVYSESLKFLYKNLKDKLKIIDTAQP
jgi:hypothetical protein